MLDETIERLVFDALAQAALDCRADAPAVALVYTYDGTVGLPGGGGGMVLRLADGAEYEIAIRRRL